MATLTESIEAVRARLIDPARASGSVRTMEQADLARAVSMAVARYSKDRPRVVVASFSGSASHYYDISTNGTAWVRGFSVVQKVDYPAPTLSDDDEPNWLDQRDYEVYLSATDTEYWYFPVHEPGTADTVRVWYTAPHIHTSTKDTIYANDLEPVRDLACHFACEMLATRASGSRDTSIAADSVNQRDRQLRYTQEAKAWLEKYRLGIGVPIDGSPTGQSTTWFIPSERQRREGWLLH